MKQVLIFLAFLPLVAGHAQPTDTAMFRQQLVRVAAMLDAAKYEIALREGQSALVSYQKKLPADDVRILECLLLLGDAFLEMGSHDAALQQYTEVLDRTNKRHLLSSPLRANAFNRSGEVFYRKKAWKKAENNYQAALELRLKTLGESHPKVADSYNNLGNCRFEAAQYAAAIAWHQKALGIRQKAIPVNQADLASSHNNLGNCFLALGEHDKALPHFRQSLLLRQAKFGEEHPKTALAHNSLGNSLAALGDTEEAATYYRIALDVRRKTLGNMHPQVAAVLENLGDLSLSKGDCIAALDYFRQAEAIQSQAMGSKSPSAAALLHKIGLCYQQEGEYHTALDFHQQSILVLSQAYGSGSTVVAGLLLNTGNCHLELGNYDMALEAYHHADQIFQAILPIGHPDRLLVLNNIGLVFLKKNEPERALDYFRQAEKTGGGLAIEAVHSLKNKALALGEMRRFEEALSMLGKAEALLDKHPTSTLPSPELLEIQSVRADLLLRQAQKTTNISLLDKALSAYESALQTAGTLRLTITAVESRQRWVERHFSLYGGALEANFLLWEKTGDIVHLEKAFDISEKSKGLVLMEALRKANAESMAGVPDSLLERERRLVAALNRLEKMRLGHLQTGDETAAQAAGISLAETRQSLHSLVSEFEQRFPKYHQLKYQSTSVSIAELRQKLLGTGKALVEFFMGDSTLYIFVLSQNNLRCQRLALDFPLNESVKTLVGSMQLYPYSAGDAAKMQAATFSKNAFYIYQKLWLPIADGLPENLVIVPDGILAYLPFEVLLEKMPTDLLRYKSHAYLLRRHNISYAYSAAQLLALAEKPATTAGKSLLAFAPTFEGNPGGMRSLKHNLEEAEQAHDLFGGDLRQGTSATSESFMQLAADYRILHLATHGKAAASLSEFSYLAFNAPLDAGGVSLLHVQDLYHLRLPADLVVLSACETGIGEYRSGTGMVSMASGFFYAGARSIVNTLWSVDDARNARLMALFFENIKKGLPKDKALRLAKLSFLDAYPHDEAHPAFWAAPIAFGNMEPLSFSRFNWWGVAIVAVFLALFLVWKMKR